MGRSHEVDCDGWQMVVVVMGGGKRCGVGLVAVGDGWVTSYWAGGLRRVTGW